jgi:hypothetical protein
MQENTEKLREIEISDSEEEEGSSIEFGTFKKMDNKEKSSISTSKEDEIVELSRYQDDQLLFERFSAFLKSQQVDTKRPLTQKEEVELFEKFKIYESEQNQKEPEFLVTREEQEEHMRTTGGFKKTIVPFFDGKEVKPVVTDIRNELAFAGLVNFVLACEKNHFHLVYPQTKSKSKKRRNRRERVVDTTVPLKKGMHVFCLYPTSKSAENIRNEAASENVSTSGEQISMCSELTDTGLEKGNTNYSFIEEYDFVIEKVKHGKELEKMYDYKTMVMVCFIFPLEGGGADGSDCVLNIHLYNIKTKKRITTDNRIRIDYF